MNKKDLFVGATVVIIDLNKEGMITSFCDDKVFVRLNDESTSKAYSLSSLRLP